MSKPKITPLENGPLLVTDLEHFANSRGPLDAAPKMALCRCGESANKPFCDGAHVAAGFQSAKDDDRTPDRCDEYTYGNVTVHDNRGACAHSGVCTERLPKVWRMKEEPWIHPESAEAQQLAAVVRACPSGALSITIDGRDESDQTRAPQIEVAKNGPYVVTGSPDLENTEFCDGVSAEHFTLCRCGGSKNKPFCDGTHWSREFTDDKN